MMPTSTTSNISQPPWQFRWKRPKWDHVIFYNDEIADENDVTDIKRDHSEVINDKWTPISNASVVLTRREAQTVIRELHRRNKLNTNNVPSRRGRSGDIILVERSRKSVETPPNYKPPPSSQLFASWWKSFIPSGTSKEYNNTKNNNRLEQAGDHYAGDGNKINIKSTTIATNRSNNNHNHSNEGKLPIISIASPLPKKPNTNFGDDIHCCNSNDNHHDHDDDDDNLSPPSSPTSFSTFSLQPTPKKNNNMNCKMILHDTIENNNRNDGKEDWRGNEGGGGGSSASSSSSPQILSDASMASSLLWGEDMTLTTVSEDEAASYRFHQQYAGADGGSTTASTGIGWGGIGGGSYEMDDDGQRYRASSPATKTANDAAGNRILARSQRRGHNEEWGGYDHVVLSVTIFATEGAAATSTSSCSWMDAALDERQRSGEVVVMELLSTKDPPLSGSILPPTMSVPPPPSSRLPPRGREKYTPSIASGVVNSDDNDDCDDNDTKGNHTRILYRRVLWWPSSIRSGRGVAKNRRGDAENDRDRSEAGTFPSFVALGRTSIWKHIMDEDRSPLNPDDDDDQNKGHVCDKKIHRKQCGPTSHDDEDRNERAADAMEAVRSLNFLLGVGGVKTSSTVTGTQKPPLYSPPKVTATNAINTRRGKVNVANGEHSKPKDGGEKPVKIMKKITQPLSMCMVTSDGQVHFFYALRVLLGGTPKKHIGDNGESKNDMDLSSSFAALMFGSKMFARVNSNVLPLSHPHASMKLSLIDSSRVVMSDDIRDQNSNSLDRNSKDSFSQHFDHSADVKMGVSENEQDAHWSSIGLFDATIDPASIHMRTLRRSNTLTGSCITSDTNNSYLAVCGRGLCRTVHRDDNGHQRSSHILGGFVTFVSLRHYTESRTIYLPFAPASMQPVYWAGMHFVALLGEKASQEVPRRRRPFAMLVRVDCGQGEERSNIGNMARNYTAHPARFQCLSVMFPSVKESLGSLSNLLTTRELDRMYSKAVAISSIPSSPPEILLTFQTGSTFFAVNQSLLPSQRGDTTTMVNSLYLSTVIRPGRRALLDIGAKDNNVTQSETMQDFSRVWCAGGQGWSLLGTHGAQGKSFFICWDGSVDDNQGPFILPFHLPVLSDSSNGVCLISSVMPLMSYVKHAEKSSEYSCPSISNCHIVNDRVDFSSGFIPENSFASTLNESTKLVANTEGGLDGIIVNALESISIQFTQTPENAKTLVGARMNRSKSFGLSCQEKSNRLLQQCSSWTALENPKENLGVVNGQVIMTTIRFGSHFQSLTLRTNIVANPFSTPFQTVLGWLCQQRDYYTAASIALSLLDDAEAVYELCGIPRSLEESMYHHKGLIDGIKPLFLDSALGVVSETLVSLADMAVACLIKGGSCMSTTLEGFLARNKLYSAPRASLMLVGTMAAAVSKETVPDIEQTIVHNIVEMVANAINPSDDVLWPLRCLMKMAVVRNCLHSTILMLNATIPNELRWRAPKSQGLASASRPSLGLFLSFSGMILESTTMAIRYFLQMMDEETGLPYWFSVDDDTRLALILMPIRGKRVMLQEPEVRMWALDRLHEEIKLPGTDSAYPAKGSLLQNGLLTEIVIGALCNAQCFICQGMDTSILRNVSSMTEDEDDMCYHQDMLRVRDLLVPNNGCLDFDLVIPALLILARRGCDHWREGSQISTQILLNTACDLAGKKSEFEPKFVFDAASAMRQCALANNLQAAALLIGGRKGLIIECMDLLVSCLDLTAQDAELMLYTNSLVELSRDVPLLHEVEQKNEEDSTIFVPSESHRHLLWLLQEHVLNVHTYGNFDDETHSRGKITPVFAGRICFRAWYILTSPSALPSSVLWLENWLRRHLAIACGKSSKRLACAALIRVLLWADESDDIDLMEGEEEENNHLSLLATVIGLKRQFLAELAQACCGLIQSIPPHVAEELMSSCTPAGGSKFDSYESLEKTTTVQKLSPY